MDYKIEAENYFLSKNISKESADKFIKLSIIKKIRKGTTLLSMGNKTNEIYLILKGIVRGFYITEEGDDITKCFSMEQNWCCVYNLLKSELSEYWIETLEDCIFMSFKTNDILELVKKDSEIQMLYSKLFTEAFINGEKRIKSLKDKSASQRYVELQKIYPLLEQRVEQKYIASYLGVTPSSLSRLKRNLHSQV